MVHALQTSDRWGNGATGARSIPHPCRGAEGRGPQSRSPSTCFRRGPKRGPWVSSEGTWGLRLSLVPTPRIQKNAEELEFPKTALVAGHIMAGMQWGCVGLAVASSQPCGFWSTRSFDALGELQGICACSNTGRLAPQTNREAIVHNACPFWASLLRRCRLGRRLKLANSGRVLAQVAPMPQYGLIGETRACT